jgi:hypothetical protein
MKGKDIPVRVKLPDDLSEGPDGDIIVLGGHGKLFLVPVPGQITVFQNLILGVHLLGIGDKFPAFIRQ